MRKLGRGQSVVFLIPEEIQTKIRSRVSKSGDTTLDVSDVLQWAISETMFESSRNIALWAVQGSRFMRQSRVWKEHGGRMGLTMDAAKKLLEADARTLEDRHSARPRDGLAFLEEQSREDSNVLPIIERCRKFADVDVASSSLYEEQARELAPEIEQEREIKRPLSFKPALHSVHEHVRLFVRTGVLKKDSNAFVPAFKALASTTAAQNFELRDVPYNDLLVTKDFIRTVEIPSEKNGFLLDSYQRQVQWVLSCADDTHTVKHLVIISPYEADELLDEVSKSATTTLHLYSPCHSLNYRALDHLMLYTTPERSTAPIIPRHLIIQLNLFSGQLYLSSYDEYLAVCEFLNLASEMTPDGWTVAADGFILSRGMENGVSSKPRFRSSPVQFLKILISQIRRNCEDIDKTHIGKILNGELLQPEDFPS